MKERMTIDSLQMSTPVASPASVKVKKFVVDDNEEDRLVTSPTKHSVGDTPTKKWIRKEKIGQGAQGAVYRCEEAATGKEVAAKVILTHELSPSEVEAIRREVKIIKRLQHPNLVQYYKATGNKKHTMNIYMEYVSGGSLSGKLRREGALPLPTIKKYTRQLLKALQYLHQNRIAHRDIKCANIFLTSDEKLIKLGDFGAFKEMGSVSLVGGIKGTPHWMAPEVIREQQTSSDGWFKADIWSLGCTVLEMLTGHAPWQQYSNPLTAMYQIVCSNATPTIPDSAPEDTTTFLKWCLQRNPDDRPSTDQLLDHEFAKKKTTNRKASIKRKSVTIESENQAEKPFLLLSPIGKETQPQRSAGCETDDEEHEDTIELSHDLSASSIADEKATATKGCEAKHPLPMHAPRRPSLIPRYNALTDFAIVCMR
ncbi:TPA: hypothetical protein N0F65_010491 [Lagenidium giganteum]|uniref:Protein kinase domain-containing protein n=1 Tax=Lagenidium giganteum TaxID=4803 RepID=A0AAV2Z5N7_9STRA|nr:TPA: hypothetical protein N0F65_010491 [Lagenidium giganteum]